MFEFPVLDNHVHLQPRGRNVEGVKDFLKAGGTHLIVSHMPYQEAPVRSAEDFRSAYGITLRMVEGARSAGAGAFATLGPYPVQLLELAEAMRREAGSDQGVVAMRSERDQARPVPPKVEAR